MWAQVRFKTPLWQSGKQSFPSLFLHLLVFISTPLPSPPYKGKLSTISIFRWFIAFGTATTGGCANLCQWFGKKENFPLPSGQFWASHWGSHTCNMAESLYGQHFCFAPAITQFAAVFEGWQHCLHPIAVCGWIQGKTSYLPGFTDGVMIDLLWLLE